MRDYLELGATPSGEECAQLGSDNYEAQSKVEIKAFKNQMVRVVGEPPPDGQLRGKTFQHDFGSYRELVVFFDDEDDVSQDYAYKCESETPEYWDEEALKELEEAGFPAMKLERKGEVARVEGGGE